MFVALIVSFFNYLFYGISTLLDRTVNRQEKLKCEKGGRARKGLLPESNLRCGKD